MLQVVVSFESGQTTYGVRTDQSPNDRDFHNDPKTLESPQTYTDSLLALEGPSSFPVSVASRRLFRHRRDLEPAPSEADECFNPGAQMYQTGHVDLEHVDSFE